jgi:hypothetical protein
MFTFFTIANVDELKYWNSKKCNLLGDKYIVFENFMASIGDLMVKIKVSWDNLWPFIIYWPGHYKHSPFDFHKSSEKNS